MIQNTSQTIIQQDVAHIAQSIEKPAKILEGKTILITGGSGFLGNYLVETISYLNTHIFKTPCRVISIDNYITSRKKRKKDKTYILQIDHDIDKPLRIQEPIDYIIHAAGIASPMYYHKYPLETIDVAVNGTRNILELARIKHAKSVVYFSSSEIYGDPTPDAIPTKETYLGNVSSIGTRACYDESKRLGETLCMTYFRLYKTPVKIVRPFNIYGPGMKKNDFRVIPTFISQAIEKKKTLSIYGDGRQTRAFCYITDATEGFFRVLFSRNNGQVYNVGNGENEINIDSLARMMKKMFTRPISIAKITYPKAYPQDEPKRRCPDISKIRKELGFKPKVPLQKGLQRTIEWCRSNWKIV